MMMIIIIIIIIIIIMVISQDVPLYRFDLNKKLDETSLIDPDVIEIAVN